jgi:two-component system, LytTR family, response regulator LytT
MLDINLNNRDMDKDGLSLARRMRETKDDPFIFLTAYDDMETIKKAAQLRPSAYLIKPVNAATLFAAVQTAIENYLESKPAVMPHEKYDAPDYFFSKIGAKLHKVYWKDVAKMESVKNYVSIKTSNSNSEYLIRGSLVQVMQNMVPLARQQDFFKINRATILHRSAIVSVRLDCVHSTFGMLESTEDTIRELKKALF